MGGTQKNLNIEMKSIEKNIKENCLDQMKVVAIRDDYTEEGIESIRQHIDSCVQTLLDIQFLTGEMHNMTLPSGQLVGSRNKWIEAKNHLQETSEKVLKSMQTYLDFLQDSRKPFRD